MADRISRVIEDANREFAAAVTKEKAEAAAELKRKGDHISELGSCIQELQVRRRMSKKSNFKSCATFSKTMSYTNTFRARAVLHTAFTKRSH